MTSDITKDRTVERMTAMLKRQLDEKEIALSRLAAMEKDKP